MKKFLTVGMMSMSLLFGAAASCDSPQPTEVEDCDYEDYVNREDDCGFTDADRKKSTPKPKTTKRK